MSIGGINRTCVWALAGVSAAAIISPMWAQDSAARSFDIPAQEMTSALETFAKQSDTDIIFDRAKVSGRKSAAISGKLAPTDALSHMIAGSGLSMRRVNAKSFIVEPAPFQKRSSIEEDSETNVEQVIMTGTRIRENNTTVPIRVIGREEIDNSGYHDTGSLIRSLPEAFGGGQNPGVSGASTSVMRNQNVSNASTVNLRGLGSDATLVLFNGHRMSADSFFQASDISGIPMDALDRIEVVKDGASAVYGSDAVAGVVNFVLRKNYDGISVNSRFGTTTQGGGEEQTYSLLAGTSSDHWHVLASGEYSDQGAVLSRQRQFTSQMYPDNSLSNSQIRRSAVVSAGVDAYGVELSLDGIYTKRTALGVNGYSLTEPVLTTSYNNDEHSVAISLKKDIGSTWTVEMTGVDSGSTNAFIDNNGHSAYENNTTYVEGSASGTLFSIFGVDVKAAFGGGARHEGYQQLNLSTGVASTKGKRNVAYAFSELLIPFVDKGDGIPGLYSLELSFSARYENYSEFGDSTNPRLGLSYAPLEDVTIKGSWGKSFKAPSLQQQFEQSYLYLFPAATYGSAQAGTGLMTWGGNPNLKPEKSDSWTTGVEYQPSQFHDLSLSATYFDIDYKGRIVQPVPAYSRALIDPVYAPFLIINPSPTVQQNYLSNARTFYNLSGETYDPANVLLLVENRYTNAASQRAQGIDFGYRQSFSFDTGRLTTFANATWLHLTQQTSSVAAMQVLTGTLNNAPDFKARAGATWTYDGWATTWIVNYLNSSLDNVTVPYVGIASWTTVDMNLDYNFHEQEGWRSGMKLSLSVTNLLDEDPPYVRGASVQQYGQYYDSTNTSPIGRFVSIQISKSF